MFMRVRSVACLTLLALLAGCDDGPDSGGPKELKGDAPTKWGGSAEDLPKSLIGRDGERVDLSKYLGKPVVLVVVRGLPESPGGEFCPFCLRQADRLTANYEKFKSRGAEVLLLFPGTGDQADAFAKEVRDDADGVPFPVFVDKECTACDGLGIRGDLAKPSTFVLDSEGNVAYAYVGEDPSDRPAVKTILAQLDRLNEKKTPPGAAG